jgi:hypothetical protein
MHRFDSVYDTEEPREVARVGQKGLNEIGIELRDSGGHPAKVMVNLSGFLRSD